MSKSHLVSGPFVRSPYNYDRDAASNETAISCKDPSLAQQNFKESCDINFIVEHFLRTGEAPFIDAAPLDPTFYGSIDYHTAMLRIARTDAEFMKLDANVRARFRNDPAQLIAFLDNPDNRAEAASLGLVLSSPAAPASSGGAERKPPKSESVAPPDAPSGA